MIRRFALPLVLVLLAAGAACGGPRRGTASFATRNDAGNTVPAWVPASASELKLQEEDADGAFWLRFRLPAADRPALESELLRIPDGQVATLTFRAPKGADWWFRGLVQVVPARERSVIAADVYSGSGRAVSRRTFVAFDRASDSVFAWGTGR